MKKEVVELCPHCENEVVMEWNTDMDGFKAFCPHCGNRLMLCDECQHRHDGKYCSDCDYDRATDSCRFNPAQPSKPSLIGTGDWSRFDPESRCQHSACNSN